MREFLSKSETCINFQVPIKQVVVFNGTTSEKVSGTNKTGSCIQRDHVRKRDQKMGPNFEGPGKGFRHQIIKYFFGMHMACRVIFKMHI